MNITKAHSAPLLTDPKNIKIPKCKLNQFPTHTTPPSLDIQDYLPGITEDTRINSVEDLQVRIEKIQLTKNKTFEGGRTILHQAIKAHDYALCELILRLAPSLAEKADSEGITPLIYAASHPSKNPDNTIKIIEILFNQRAYQDKIKNNIVDIVPVENQNPGHILLALGEDKIAQFFFQNMPYAAEHTNFYGLTPAECALHQAYLLEEKTDAESQEKAQKFRHLAEQYRIRPFPTNKEIKNNIEVVHQTYNLS